MLLEIQSALSTVKSIGELTSLVINSKADGEVKAKATELNNSILSLQNTLFSLQTQNHELLDSKREIEEKYVNLSNWKKKAKRYELSALCPGVFVYSLKEKHHSSEPPHNICAKCYEDSKAYILQASEIKTTGIHYLCPNCETTIINYNNKKPIQPYQSRPSTNWQT